MSKLLYIPLILAYCAVILVFAGVYCVVDDKGLPSSFDQAVYFSIITITTVGYGDFSPATAVGQAATALQAALGILIFGLFLTFLSIDVAERNRISNAKQAAKERKAKNDYILATYAPRLSSLIVEYTYQAFCMFVTVPRSQSHFEDWLREVKDEWPSFKEFGLCLLPSTVSTDDLNKLKIQLFFDAEQKLSIFLAEAVGKLAFEDDDTFLSLSQQFLAIDLRDKYVDSINSHISRFRDPKFREVISQIFELDLSERQSWSSNIATPYLVVYLSLKKRMPIALEIQSHIHTEYDDKLLSTEAFGLTEHFENFRGDEVA